jgi:hypothetical protein
MQCSYSEGQSAVVTEIKLMLATALSLGIRKFLIEEDREDVKDILIPNLDLLQKLISFKKL